MNTKEIAQNLADDGFSLEYICTQEGDCSTESKWQCVLAKGGRTYSFEYTKGAAHRRYAGNQHKGRMLPYKRLRLADQIAYFNSRTVPMEPTLDEVMYSLVMDASCVEYSTFDDFCAEMGYDADSRKALDIYNQCNECRASLAAMGVDMEQMQELFQDY